MRKTSFGTMRTLLEKNGNIIAEHLTFENEGWGHSHDLWEICYITEGQGIIFVGEKEVHVKDGDVCKIPPNTNHWMKPEPYMEILLVYSNQE
ncbi:cupin domain-containing protein [bacterium]|nr:MAG: cupin domain-containing protein [bacterium]